MKKILYIYLIFALILISFVMVIPNNSYAGDDINLGDLNGYKNDNANLGVLENKANAFISILSTIGSVVSVIALIALGLKYMMGSIEEKAEYKETLKPYLIGAFLVFTISLIPNIIYKIMQNL